MPNSHVAGKERPPCGTHSAYTSHYYHGETPCEACKAAQREYRRGWRKAKAAAK